MVFRGPACGGLRRRDSARTPRGPDTIGPAVQTGGVHAESFLAGGQLSTGDRQGRYRNTWGSTCPPAGERNRSNACRIHTSAPGVRQGRYRNTWESTCPPVSAVPLLKLNKLGRSNFQVANYSAGVCCKNGTKWDGVISRSQITPPESFVKTVQTGAE